MIKIFDGFNKEEIPFKSWIFPGKEIGVQIEKRSPNTLYEIVASNPSSNDLFVLANLINALKYHNVKKDNIYLRLPYVPYGRQDRVCHNGESLALSVFASFLKSIAYWRKLYIQDPHSDATIAWLTCDNYELVVISQGECAQHLPSYNYLIAPDKGASLKLKDHNQIHYGTAIPLYLNKVRTDSGVKHEPLQDNIIVGTTCIVDDICDGGATFLSVGNMLRQNQPRMTQLDLYVTHGLFSKGTSELDKLFDNIYTANNFNPFATSVKVI